MTAREGAEQELNAMLDEGVTVTLVDVDVHSGTYELRLVLDESACADCLVPDPALVSIATDALERRGETVRSMSVLRPGDVVA
jgi:hypothetical protein